MQRQYRLTNQRSFDYIYKHGKCVSDDLCTLVYVEGKYPVYKVGFVVAKKVGKAVVRNKVRRRMREAFRLLEVKEFHSYIIVAHSIASEATYLCIKESIKTLFEKAGMLK